MIDLLMAVDGSVSFPYTSTKLIGDSLGKPATYFFPREYRRAFAGTIEDPEVVFGREELSRFLKEQVRGRFTMPPLSKSPSARNNN
jgi:hypothetical protein